MIISESAGSFSKPKIVTSLILGASLFTGFAFGMSITPESLSHLNPFRTETLEFHKIAWLSRENVSVVKPAVVNPNSSVEFANAPIVGDVVFVPFELKEKSQKPLHLRAFSASKPKNFERLEKTVSAINEAIRYDAFVDYKEASSHLRNEFLITMNEAPASGAPAREMIAMTSSSAEIKETNEVASPHVSHAPVITLDEKPVPVTAFMSLAVKPTPPVSIQESQGSYALRADYHVLTAPVPLLTAPSAAKGNEQTIVEDAQPNGASITPSQELSKADQKKLTDALLTFQLDQAKQTQAAMVLAQNNQIHSSTPSLSPSSKSNDALLTKKQALAKTADKAELIASKILDDKEAVQDDQTAHEISEVNEKLNTGCEVLSTHRFIMATGEAATDLPTQVCPGKLAWISKSRKNEGWVKVEGDTFFSTLTLEPPPNQGSTLLLDTNSLGLLALKDGIHVTKGMGLIVGLVPDGYKVDYAGRAEDTQYFNSGGKTYFAILNAEPGAGVVEVSSKTDPNLNSTVFVPILGDTISYVDLATPVARTLNIKVVKSGAENDPEVAKLTVGLSTQSGIQAITRTDGQASLKSVNLVPGFPVFIDVSSRVGDEQSYTYRYEIKHPARSSVNVVNEVSDKSIHHWLDQVKQGLSDQSAMVIGLYDRKKLNGFKTLHYSHVDPLTAKFGLEPINFSILWDGKLSSTDPLEGDVPRFMSVQVPEGLSQINLINEAKQVETSELIPVSPRVVHVISD